MTTTPKGWWYRASTEAKLRQVDAGIELGMTAAQIALCSNSRRGTVAEFANYHGRHFQDADVRSRPVHSKSRARRLFFDRKRYLAGEPVDFFDPRQRATSPDDIAEVSFE